MLRVIYLGMDLQILAALKSYPVELIGAYLPSAPYWLLRCLPFLVKHPPWFLKKTIKPVALYGALFQYLLKSNIPYLQSPDVNAPEFFRTLSALHPDLGIVANFGKVLGERLLGIPKYGFINFHPSLLPRYRGPSPLHRMLLNGETCAGVTWHRMTDTLDQGDILAQMSFKIQTHDTLKDLAARSSALAVKMLHPLIRQIQESQLRPRPQSQENASYYPKLTPEEKKQLKSMGKIP
jgi:methionyl-tRNA formyltransferase